MKNLLHFEYLKIKYQKKLIFMSLSVIVVQLLMALFIKYNTGFKSVDSGINGSFSAPAFIGISVIFLACRIFAEDFEYRTIIPITVKYSNKLHLFLAKGIMVAGIYLFLLVLCGIFTLLLSVVLFNQSIDFNMIVRVFAYNLSSMIPTYVVILLSVLIIIVTRKETMGLVLGMFIYVCYAIGIGINFLLVSYFKLAKYGIINLFMLSNQIVDSSYQELTLLSINEMLVVLSVYIILELIVLYWLIKRIEN